jgi:hypothetical protein
MTTPTTADANRSCPACGRRTYGFTPDALFDLLTRDLTAAVVAVRATELRRFATRIGACACAPAAVPVSWRSVSTPPPLPADAHPVPASARAPVPATEPGATPARAASRRRAPLLHRLGLRALLGPREPREAPASLPGLLEWALCQEDCR